MSGSPCVSCYQTSKILQEQLLHNCYPSPPSSCPSPWSQHHRSCPQVVTQGPCSSSVLSTQDHWMPNILSFPSDHLHPWPSHTTGLILAHGDPPTSRWPAMPVLEPSRSREKAAPRASEALRPPWPGPESCHRGHGILFGVLGLSETFPPPYTALNSEQGLSWAGLGGE